MHPRSPFADRYAARAFAIEELAKKAGGGLMEEIAALPPAAKGALLGGAGGIVSGLVSDQPGSVIRHGLIGAGLGAAGGWGGSALMDYLAAHGGGDGPDPSSAYRDLKPQDTKTSVGEPQPGNGGLPDVDGSSLPADFNIRDKSQVPEDVQLLGGGNLRGIDPGQLPANPPVGSPASLEARSRNPLTAGW